VRVSWLSLKSKANGLSVIWPQNHWDSFLRFGLKTDGDGFLPVWPQNRWRRFLPIWPQNWWLEFPSLGLKIGSYGLVIWASKSPRRFLGLGLKTKQTTVCRLHHNTDGRARGMGHASRSSSLLHVEANQTRVF
jgi:hypothetical protein